LVCLNCSPFYRRKTSESPNLSTGTLEQSAEVFERSSHTNVGGLTRTQMDKHHGWSNVDQPSTVSVESVTEVNPAVDGTVYGHPSLSSSSQQTVTVVNNSWVSSAAATSVLSNGWLLLHLSVYQYMKCCCIVACSLSSLQHTDVFKIGKSCIYLIVT